MNEDETINLEIMEEANAINIGEELKLISKEEY